MAWKRSNECSLRKFDKPNGGILKEFEGKRLDLIQEDIKHGLVELLRISNSICRRKKCLLSYF